MNEQQQYPFVARMHGRALKQARAIASASRTLLHRHTKLGTGLGAGLQIQSQVGHGHNVQSAVEDAENFIALEVQAVDIALNLLIVGRIAKAQVAVLRVQGQQVLKDAGPLLRTQGANRHHHALRGRHIHRARQRAGEDLASSIQRSFEQGPDQGHTFRIRVFPDFSKGSDGFL